MPGQEGLQSSIRYFSSDGIFKSVSGTQRSIAIFIIGALRKLCNHDVAGMMFDVFNVFECGVCCVL